MKFYKYILVLLDTLVLVCLFNNMIFAAENSRSGGIVYLQLKMQNSVITLVNSSIVPGSYLYPSPDNHGDIVYRVENTSGIQVGSGALNDPTLVYGDYIDPDNPGKLKGEVIKLGEAVFVVRIPYTLVPHNI